MNSKTFPFLWLTFLFGHSEWTLFVLGDIFIKYFVYIQQANFGSDYLTKGNILSEAKMSQCTKMTFLCAFSFLHLISFHVFCLLLHRSVCNQHILSFWPSSNKVTYKFLLTKPFYLASSSCGYPSSFAVTSSYICAIVVCPGCITSFTRLLNQIFLYLLKVVHLVAFASMTCCAIHVKNLIITSNGLVKCSIRLC